MNEEQPEILGRALPPAPAALRARVLGALQQELLVGEHNRRVPRRWLGWERVFELTSAASLLIGLSVTVWQWRADQAWHRRMDALQFVENRNADRRDPLATTDPQLAQLLRRRAPVAPRNHDLLQFSENQARLLQEIAALNGG